MNEISEFQGKYRWLSNFWSCMVEYEGLRFASSEAAYQAAKCANDFDKLQFIGIEPGASKRLGRHINIRHDWEKVKIHVMTDIVRAKFKQNDDLRKLLIDTGDAKLVEGNTWNDTFWGVCNGIGRNELGKILMKVRQEETK